MAAPLQHITGVLNAMTIPLLTGACSIIAERWLPDRAAAAIVARRVTWTAGATVFLQELTEAARAAGVRLPLRMFACGGASVPRVVLERSKDQGIPAARVYGLTELPTVTVMNGSQEFDLRAGTDGAVAPGVEVRVVDGDALLPAGAEGELLVRGPERIIGYLDAAATDAAIDGEGWLRTGDVGFLDSDGYVTVTGGLEGTSSTAAARSSPPETSRICLCGIQRSGRPRLSPALTRGSARCPSLSSYWRLARGRPRPISPGTCRRSGWLGRRRQWPGISPTRCR